jgi:hypothetical protein
MVLRKASVRAFALLLAACSRIAFADEEIEDGLVRLTRAAYDAL